MSSDLNAGQRMRNQFRRIEFGFRKNYHYLITKRQHVHWRDKKIFPIRSRTRHRWCFVGFNRHYVKKVILRQRPRMKFETAKKYRKKYGKKKK